MARRAKILLLSILAVITLCFCLAWPSINRGMGERECAGNLTNLYVVINLYRSKNQGSWPKDMRQALLSAGGTDIFEQCPAVGKKGQIDYTYINWSNQTKGPDFDKVGYPMIYDCRLGNHGGRGINILMTDGTIIWDPGAGWLQRFAENHPADKIPIPQ